MGNTPSVVELLVLASISQCVLEDGFWNLHSSDVVAYPWEQFFFYWIIKLSACEPLEMQVVVTLDSIHAGTTHC